MERFQLPEQLPATVEELNALHSTVMAQINLLQARVRAGETLGTEDVGYLRSLLDARDTITAEVTAMETAENQHRQELADLLARAEGPGEAAATETAAETGEAAATERAVEPDQPVVTPEPVAPANPEVVMADGAEVVVASTGSSARPVNFSGLEVNDAPVTPAGPGWRMRPDAPGYVSGNVGFSHIGKALDSQIRGSRKIGGSAPQSRGSYMAQVLADLRREAPVVSNSHELVTEIERATTSVPKGRGIADRVPVTAEALVASGGWCAPSETLYDFCDVPAATDLISVPEITIVRGGVRWPVEPDLTSIFENFEFFFTEPELEATDSYGMPQARKECIDIPCPTEFEEMRLNVVGYCVEAGILQTQGWPELITWFTQKLVAEHLRAISRRTILDMVNGSTLETFSSSYLIGSAGAVINSLDLMATNIRLNRGLARNAAIEAVAPSWLLSALRADVAYYQHTDTKAVSDAEILQWFSHRGISLQLVGDWQTRGVGQPGSLGTVTWPGSVDVLLYPAGTWFRAMQNVIELGVMYPKEELVLNRYTRMFTEDAIAVGSRCYPSVVARIPLNVSGGYGAQYTLSSPSYTSSAGELPSGAPVVGGPSDFTLGHVYTIAVTGSPTGGSFILALDGNDTTAIAYNATAEDVQLAFEGLEGYTSDDFAVSSSTTGEIGAGQLPGDVLTLQVPVGTVVTSISNTFTGGTSPGVTLTQVS